MPIVVAGVLGPLIAGLIFCLFALFTYVSDPGGISLAELFTIFGIYIIFDLQDIICMGDNTFAKEEAHSKFMVVTRRTHNHSKTLVVDTHLKGFFNSEGVLALL